MKIILSNKINKIPFEKLYKLCEEVGADMELFVDDEFLRSVNAVAHKKEFDAFVNTFKNSSVKLKGLALDLSYGYVPNVFYGKVATELLKAVTGGYIKLIPPDNAELNDVLPIVEKIGRFASLRNGGGEFGECGTVVCTKLPSNCNAEIFSRANHSLKSTCVGLYPSDSDVKSESFYNEIIKEYNQFESTMLNAECDEANEESDIIRYAKALTTVYDGDLTVNITNGKAQRIKNITVAVKEISFDEKLYDYSKISCPSSVSRIIRNGGLGEFTDIKKAEAGSEVSFTYKFTLTSNIAENGGIKLCFNHAARNDSISPQSPSVVINYTGKTEYSKEVLFEDACEVLNIKAKNGIFKAGEVFSISIGGKRPFKLQTYECRRMAMSAFIDFTGHGNYFAQSTMAYFEITGGKADHIIGYVPIFAKQKEKINIFARIEDKYRNVSPENMGAPELHLNGTKINSTPVHTKDDYNCWLFENVEAPIENGDYYYEIKAKSGNKSICGTTNYISVTENGQNSNGDKLFFGDIHCHTALMDGFGNIEEFYDYARNKAYLDFVCHSDHMDGYQGGRQCSNQKQWEMLKAGVKKHHEPGRLVTMLGYENAEDFGDMNVYFKTDEAPWRVSCSLKDMVEFAKRNDAIIIPHMTSYEQGIRGYDFSYFNNEVMPAIEIYSCHGSNEYFGGEQPLHFCEPTGFATDALAIGHKIAFMASGDGHECLPGNAAFNGKTNGLVGVFVKELTREAIINAIENRRCYATTNLRSYGDYAVNEVPMGGCISFEGEQKVNISGKILADSELESVWVVKDGAYDAELCIDGIDGTDKRKCEFKHTDTIEGKHNYYIKAKQKNGGMIWLSPVYINYK